MAVPRNVLHNNAWCPTCANNQRKKYEEVKKIALQYEGKLLSSKYINSKSKLKWKCKNGHVFDLSYSKVAHRGQWCPFCKKCDKQKIAA